jgi:hypothetical protein
LGKAVPSKNEPHTFDFYINAGDNVQFSYQHSVFSWLTPFEMNFMTGHSPNKKRNAYYLLTWRKRDGTVLRARWEFEQWKYQDSDWGDWKSRHRSDGQTGLVEILIERK